MKSIVLSVFGCFAATVLPGAAQTVLNLSPSAPTDPTPPVQTMNKGKPQYVIYKATGSGTLTIGLSGPDLSQTGLLNTGIFPYSGTALWQPHTGSGSVVAVSATGSGTSTSYSRSINIEDISVPTNTPPPCYSSGSPTGACVELFPAGEAAIGSGPDGFADPSMRRDSVSGKLWLSYSHPTTVSSTQVIEIHLGYSSNGGSSWSKNSVLYNSAVGTGSWTVCDSAGKLTSHEVSNLWPNSGSWYIVHAEYCADSSHSPVYYYPFGAFLLAANIGSISNPKDPTTLQSSPTTTTSPWTFTSLTATANSLLGLTGSNKLTCDSGWNEPSIFTQDTTLYLTARCVQSAGSGPAFYLFTLGSLTDLALTDVSSVVGPFGGNADVRRLTGTTSHTQYYTQFDVAKRATLGNDFIGIATIYDNSSGVEARLGCHVFTFNPTASSPTGILSSIEAYIPDTTYSTYSGSSTGQAACAYEATSPTGVLVTRREGASGSIVAHMLETGVMP